jgi:hypothetical protein
MSALTMLRSLARSISHHRHCRQFGRAAKQRGGDIIKVKEIDPAKRYEIMATREYNLKKSELFAQGSGRCPHCWLLIKLCICKYADGSGLTDGAGKMKLPRMPHK